MAWIESHQSLGTHRKLVRLAKLLGVSRPQAVGHLHYFWWWCLDNAPSGDLGDLDASEISEVALWPGDPDQFVTALKSAGWLDGQGLHDWQDYAGKLLDRRALNRTRMAHARAAHVLSTLPARAGATVPNSTNSTNSTIPPSPTPSPLDKQCNRNEGKLGILSRFTEAQRDELHTKFPGLDLEFEAGKCEAWWAEGKREMKRPKLAFMNWLQKAVKGRSRPGAPRESHEYTRPEEAD